MFLIRKEEKERRLKIALDILSKNMIPAKVIDENKGLILVNHEIDYYATTGIWRLRGSKTTNKDISKLITFIKRKI